MGKLIPILIAIVGLGAGIGGGVVFRPEPAEVVVMNPCGNDDGEHTNEAKNPAKDEGGEGTDAVYVKLNNQFVIPVVNEGDVSSLVVLSLTLEVDANGQDQVYQHEPKLRDVFLQVLFEHANAGGFDGAFTDGRQMTLLRDALRESAKKTFGSRIRDVLIVDLVRQDV